MIIDAQDSLFKASEKNTQEPLELKLDRADSHQPIPGSVLLYEQCFNDAQSQDILKELVTIK